MKLTAALLVRDGHLVNKYRFEKYLPIGRLDHTLSRLDEWQIDEITILNPTHTSSIKQDLSNLLLNMRHVLNTTTPAAYGGGIGTKEDVDAVFSFGFERVVLSASSIIKNTRLLDYLRQKWGEQSAILHIPFFIENETIMVRVENNRTVNIEDVLDVLPNNFGGELLVTSTRYEGSREIDKDGVQKLRNRFHGDLSLVYGGGVSTSHHVRYLHDRDFNGVALGNILNTKELVVPPMKSQLPFVRPYSTPWKGQV